VNTALISHILNQRLKKGEIWPSWWGGKRWGWQFWAPVACFSLHITMLFAPWALGAANPAAAVGRAVYVVALIGFMIQLFLVPLRTLRARLKPELAPLNLELSLLTHGTVGSVLATWFVTDCSTLVLRLMRYFPLLAITAAAGGIGWGDAAWFAVLVTMVGIAFVALLYAQTVTWVGIVLVVPVGWWISNNISLSLLTLEDLSYYLPRYLVALPAMAIMGLLWTWGALELRIRWTGRRRVRARRRLLPTRVLTRWPQVVLLVHGLRGGLGVFGAIPVVVVLTLAGIGVGMIPYIGGLALLIVAATLVPYFVITLHRTGAWEDVYLASDINAEWRLLSLGEAKDWTKLVATACFLAALPVLPGLVAHGIFGRLTADGAWSAFTIYREVSADAPGGFKQVIAVLAISLSAIACAGVLLVTFVVAALEDLLHRAMRGSGVGAGAAGIIIFAVGLPFVGFIFLHSMVRHVDSAEGKAVWLTATYVLLVLVAGGLAAVSYSNLHHLMAHARGLTSTDFERAWRQAPRSEKG
jgi:hypothetical protein